MVDAAFSGRQVAGAYRGLRGWIDTVDRLGELKRISGAHWDVEMGAVTHMLTEKSGGTAPAILFDDVPGYRKGFRTLYGQLSSVRRIALTLGLPLQHERKVDIVQHYHARMQDLRPLPPRYVNDGPIFENVTEGDAVDVLKFPVPRHHERDQARFIGTADCVVTKDPDSGWYNLGAYRSQVYDGPATRFTAIQIRQRYPGHARQALHVACACQGGAYAGKWTVVVDDDIDAGDLNQVLWAMCTRFDPKVDIDLVQKAWASKRDPLYLPGNFNNRILIDACIPYDMKLKNTFPQVVDVSADLRAKLRAKFPALFQ